jgi:site-specific recombinase XerD
LRSSDIVKLEFKHIDSQAKVITFVQEKTQEPQSLALTPELEMALAAYAKDGRPNLGSSFVFLRSAAPFAPISRASVGNIVRKYIKLADIQPAGRKSGPHSLRMTLASELVYEKVPFEVVKKIMGHKDQNVLKHYVKFDVEMLRTCSLETPAPTGGLLERMSLYEGRGGCHE